jgi:hypothetical protein
MVRRKTFFFFISLMNVFPCRIMMCPDITMKEFVVIHHEIGHIEYDILYSSQPMSYRGGANPGRLSNTCHMTQQIIISSYSLNQSSLGPSFMFIIDRYLVYTG